MTTTTTTIQPNNGINLEHMGAVREHMTEQPELGAFQWRGRNAWTGGASSTTSFHDFTGAGGEQAHRTTFTVSSDHPELFGQPDAQVTPVEHVLHALAACITAGVASVAAYRGIELTSVTTDLEGDMDLRGILGLGDARPGFSRVRAHVRVEGDASPEQLRSVVERSTQRSAVLDVLRNGVDVDVDVA